MILAQLYDYSLNLLTMAQNSNYDLNSIIMALVIVPNNNLTTFSNLELYLKGIEY